MFGYGDNGSWWLMGVGVLILVALLGVAAYAWWSMASVRGTGSQDRSAARTLLDARLVRGEVDPAEYRRLLEALHAP